MFVVYLLGRNIRYEADLVDQLFNSSEKRLARILLLLARFGKEGRPDKVIPKISQETLAEMVNTTRSRVSLFMNRFRKLGFINYNAELAVHSSLLNLILYDFSAQHLIYCLKRWFPPFCSFRSSELSGPSEVSRTPSSGVRSTRIHRRKCSRYCNGIGSAGGDKAAGRRWTRLPAFQEADLGRLPVAPFSYLFA
jgi:Crp-like helix-turn-helix domain